MCWKIVKKIWPNKCFFCHPASWSIVWKLTWIYTISSSFLFFAATALLYWIFTSQLTQENYQFLKNETILLQEMMQNQPSTYSLLQEEVIIEPTFNPKFGS